MAKLRCADYGFECEFESIGDSNKVIDEFGKHTDKEHGIDYSAEVLMQFLLRQQR